MRSTDYIIRSISPSAYIVFRDVAASNNCGLIGSSIASTTVAFSPSDLVMLEDAYSSVINYAQIPPNCPNSSASRSADSYSACFPRPRMPSQLWDMNPAWTNCNIFYEGITDPSSAPLLPTPLPPAPIDIALVPTDALVPSPTKISNPSLSAAPASAPLPPLAPVTSLPINSLPSPASMAQQVHESAEPTASHGIGDSKILPQAHPPSQTEIESSSIQSQARDSTQSPLGAGSQSGRDQQSLHLHNEGDLATGSQLLTPAEPTTKASVLTFEGITYTADTSSAFTVDGQALTTGGVITVDGTLLSLDIEGTAAIVGSSTQILGTGPITGSNAATIDLGAQTYTENSAGEFIISGQTLAKGGEITAAVHQSPLKLEAQVL